MMISNYKETIINSKKRDIMKYSEKTEDIDHEKIKEKISVDKRLSKIFITIDIASKAGNLTRLENNLKYLNEVTINCYFEPDESFLSNNAHILLIQIGFDNVNKFPLKCRTLALSIIENLTFDEKYGYSNMFYQQNIINTACLFLSAKEELVVKYSIKILINYAWIDSKFSSEILNSCPLEDLIGIIVNQNEIEKNIKYYAVSLLYALSMWNNKSYSQCFYAAVDFLLRSQIVNTSHYILWIVLNCIDSDLNIIPQFINNSKLISLIDLCIQKNSLSLNNDIQNISSIEPDTIASILIFNKFLQYSDIIFNDFDLSFLLPFYFKLKIPEENCNIIRSMTNEFFDEFIVALIQVFQKYSNTLQMGQIILNTSFIYDSSIYYFNYNYSIQQEIVKLLLITFQHFSQSNLNIFIQAHFIHIIINHLNSFDITYTKTILEMLLFIVENLMHYDNEIVSIVMDELDIELIENWILNTDKQDPNHLIGQKIVYLYNNVTNPT